MAGVRRPPITANEATNGLQASLAEWFSRTPPIGDGDLRPGAAMEALRRADNRDQWVIMGQTLSRVRVMELIVDMVAERFSLLDLLRIPGMPKARTIASWEQDYPAFREAMTFAEKMRATLLADEAVNILDNTTAKRAFQDSKRADLRMKLAAALNPKKYGKKLEVDTVHHLDALNSEEVWSQFRSILVVHRDMIAQKTGIVMDIPVIEAEIVAPETVDEEPSATEGEQGGIPGAEDGKMPLL